MDPQGKGQLKIKVEPSCDFLTMILCEKTWNVYLKYPEHFTPHMSFKRLLIGWHLTPSVVHLLHHMIFKNKIYFPAPVQSWITCKFKPFNLQSFCEGMYSVEMKNVTKVSLKLHDSDWGWNFIRELLFFFLKLTHVILQVCNLLFVGAVNVQPAI